MKYKILIVVLFSILCFDKDNLSILLETKQQLEDNTNNTSEEENVEVVPLAEFSDEDIKKIKNGDCLVCNDEAQDPNLWGDKRKWVKYSYPSY